MIAHIQALQVEQVVDQANFSLALFMQNVVVPQNAGLLSLGLVQIGRQVEFLAQGRAEEL